ncbi:MAG TPA: hypothetical protein ENJ56_06415 [Anaerolineae bacterium]|nr:hypothetical protein [Anaerolineae bacterium]
MFNFLKYNPNARSLEGLNNVRKTQFFILWAFVLLVTAYLAYKMIDATYMLISVDGIQWDYSKLAWLLYIIGVVIILAQPRYGIYLTVALALAGDYFITYWFPFELNFSSKQSLLYYNDSLKLSPLETFLLFTLLSYVLRLLLSSKWRWSEKIYFGPLFFPALGFTLFLLMGFVYGMATGGDRQIGLWEIRPILYLFLVLYLTSNLFEKREHIITFMWWIVAALTYEGIMGVVLIARKYNWSFSSFDSLGAHSAAVHFNTVFALTAIAFLYKVSWPKRLLLLSVLPPIAFTYIAMQRRSSMLTLAISLSLTGIIIFKLHRKFFYFLAPTAVILGLAYVAIFWNSNSAAAMPAQAIKSVISRRYSLCGPSGPKHPSRAPSPITTF